MPRCRSRHKKSEAHWLRLVLYCSEYFKFLRAEIFRAFSSVARYIHIRQKAHGIKSCAKILCKSSCQLNGLHSLNHPICDSCFAICRFALSILHRRVKIIPPRGRFVKSFLAVFREKFLFCVFFYGSASFGAAPFLRYFPAFCASLFQWARRAGRKCALQRQPWARRRRR